MILPQEGSGTYHGSSSRTMRDKWPLPLITGLRASGDLYRRLPSSLTGLVLFGPADAGEDRAGEDRAGEVRAGEVNRQDVALCIAAPGHSDGVSLRTAIDPSGFSPNRRSHSASSPGSA